MRQLLRMRRVGDVVGVHAGMRAARPSRPGARRPAWCLTGPASCSARTAASTGIWAMTLGSSGLVTSMTLKHIGADFMREEQHAPAIGILPQRQPLAALARAVQVAVADDLHVAGFRHRRDRVGVRARKCSQQQAGRQSEDRPRASSHGLPPLHLIVARGYGCHCRVGKACCVAAAWRDPADRVSGQCFPVRQRCHRLCVTDTAGRLRSRTRRGDSARS